MLLDHIKQSSDIKKLKEDQYPELAREIRQFLIEKISKTGGHLASNLGVVELTMALHPAFDLPKDKIVWDVGHQAYTHKLLSGRKAGFDDLRQFGGMSGFRRERKALTMPSTQGTALPPSLRVLDLPRRERSQGKIIR